MKEIIEINQRILIEAPDIIPKDSDHLIVSRDGSGHKEFKQLPARIKADLNALCARLNEVIPNDFNFLLCLGSYNPQLYLDFCDGAMSRASCSETFLPDISIFEQLEKVDWQKHRQQGMSGSQFFDGVREMSKELEPKLPLTEIIQKHFRTEIAVFEQKKRKNPAKIHLLKWREDERVTEEACASLDELDGNLIDMLATHYEIIAILEDGKPLSAGKIDELKLKTLLDMRESMPISYARAVGMF